MALYRGMPPLVVTLLVNHAAWLVGSAAAFAVGDREETPADYDLVVPPPNWNDACRVVAATGVHVAFNTFGGLKVGGLIDMWSGTLDDFLTAAGQRAKVALRLRPEAIVRIG